MLFEAIRQYQRLGYIECPRWVDIMAKAWILSLIILQWIVIKQPQIEVYLISRYDLVIKKLSCPLCQVGRVFVLSFLIALWVSTVHYMAYLLATFALERSFQYA